MATAGTVSRAEVDDRALRAATALYAFGFVVHFVDHVRRGLDVVSREVFWAGNLSFAVTVVTVALVLMRHRLAPIVAATVAFPVAIGVAAVHLLPHWSVFSDAFPGGAPRGITALSWIAVLLEIAGAIAVGFAGIMTVRQHA